MVSCLEAKRMSKLKKIRETLEGKPNVVIVAIEEKTYIPEKDGYWSQTFDFIVAPKNRLHTVDELQQFIMSLVPPGIEPTCRDNFRGFGDTIDIGVLYFDEGIGKEKIRHEIILTDEEVLSTPGFIEGKKVSETETELLRRTWIRVYPDPKIAEENYNGAYRYHIPKKLLES